MKNLKITEELHKQIKIHCAINGLKINKWVEGQLNEKINQMKINQTKNEKT